LKDYINSEEQKTNYTLADVKYAVLLIMLGPLSKLGITNIDLLILLAFITL
jgi:hypothetical protein